MRTSTFLWAAAGVALPLAGFAAWRERRRAKRHDLDDIGWVPWTVIMIIALTVAAGSVAFALKIHD
jgi:hypothetical protein